MLGNCLQQRAVTWCFDALQEFKAGKNPIMLATDVAARGLGTARTHSALQVNNLVGCIVALTPHSVNGCTLRCLQLFVSTVISAVLLAKRNQMPCLSARPACFACHSAACLSAPCPRKSRLSSGCPPSFFYFARPFGRHWLSVLHTATYFVGL